MAKKKSKAQRKKEQRRAMERKRRETGWEPPPEPDMEQERLMADMAPLLIGEEGAVPKHLAVVPFMEMILGGEDLLDEPEFDGVYAHPLLCVHAFVEGLQEQGLEDVDPDSLPTPEREEAHAELMEETAMQMLTVDLQEAILAALDELRERARAEGDEELVARAAAVYRFLDDLATDEMWANVGVVQAVVDRSLTAGMEMYDIIEEEAERAAAGKEGPGLLRRVIGATPEQKMERVLAKYPGLADFMANQVQADWEEGADALVSGELDLGFFSEAEISAAFAKGHSLGLELKKGDLVPAAGSGESAAETFALWLRSHVEELATPERLAQMRARLDEFAAQEADPSWLTFLSLLNKEIEEADASDDLYYLLVHALVGEMQNSVRKESKGEPVL